MMRRRTGFALAVVLSALVLTMMVVAVSAQRAMLAVRQSGFLEDRVALEAVTATARDTILGLIGDSAVVFRAAPGALLANGAASVGLGRATWEVRAGTAAFGIAEISATVPSNRGVSRARTRVILAASVDSLGRIHWSVPGPSGWVRIPSG